MRSLLGRPPALERAVSASAPGQLSDPPWSPSALGAAPRTPHPVPPAGSQVAQAPRVPTRLFNSAARLPWTLRQALQVAAPSLSHREPCPPNLSPPQGLRCQARSPDDVHLCGRAGAWLGGDWHGSQMECPRGVRTNQTPEGWRCGTLRTPIWTPTVLMNLCFSKAQGAGPPGLSARRPLEQSAGLATPSTAFPRTAPQCAPDSIHSSSRTWPWTGSPGSPGSPAPPAPPQPLRTPSPHTLAPHVACLALPRCRLMGGSLGQASEL